MLSFSLPSQWLFVAETKRHWAWAPSQRGQWTMWLFEQPCCTLRALQSRAADDDCRSRGTRCRGREGEVFDFKLCTRLEIYKQKRSKSSPAILLLRSAVFCGFVLIWIYSKDLHAHFVWQVSVGCAASFKRPSEVSYSPSSNSLCGLRSICPDPNDNITQ